VGILDLDQFKVLFPIGALFLERRRAITNLDPAGTLVAAKPGILHIPQVLSLCH
jgi:hypothetical protein